MSKVCLTVQPADDLVDVPRRIRLEGLAPCSQVTLRAHTRRADGIDWHSTARFEADAEGRVDLGSATPLDGDYEGVSAMGLIWSQKPDGDGVSNVFPDNLLEPLVTHLFAETSQGSAEATLVQRFAGQGVVREDVREDSCV